MSDSEDDSNSGEDCDYVPLSGDGESDSDDQVILEEKNTSCTRIGRTKCLDGMEQTEGITEKESKLLEDIPNEDKQNLEKKKKERADNLWNDFMKDVGESRSSKFKNQVSCCIPTKVNEKNTAVITKLFDFAGETIEVKEEIPSLETTETKVSELATSSGSRVKDERLCLKETEKDATKPDTATTSLGAKRSGDGLGNLLSKISKKPKISTLEKSKLDWNSFKRKEGIGDDLKVYNKGKNGFLEKRDFLDRANLRQFEIEKSFRLDLKKSTR